MLRLFNFHSQTFPIDMANQSFSESSFEVESQMAGSPSLLTHAGTSSTVLTHGEGKEQTTPKVVPCRSLLCPWVGTDALVRFVVLRNRWEEEGSR